MICIKNYTNEVYATNLRAADADTTVPRTGNGNESANEMRWLVMAPMTVTFENQVLLTGYDNKVVNP